jgi:hypothetical protein
MGLLLFVEKFDRNGNEREMHGYQFLLMLVACVSLFLFLVVGLYVLYSDVDPYGWCSWCDKLSCVDVIASAVGLPCNPVGGCSFNVNSTTNEHTYSCPLGSPRLYQPTPGGVRVTEGAGAGGGNSYTSPDIPACYTAKGVDIGKLDSCFDPGSSDQSCLLMLCESCCFT